MLEYTIRSTLVPDLSTRGIKSLRNSTLYEKIKK